MIEKHRDKGRSEHPIVVNKAIPHIYASEYVVETVPSPHNLLFAALARGQPANMELVCLSSAPPKTN